MTIWPANPVTSTSAEGKTTHSSGKTIDGFIFMCVERRGGGSVRMSFKENGNV